MAEETIEERDRALYEIMINEVWPLEGIVAMIAEGDRSKLNELLAKMRADPRRQRDVEIITPDQMKPGLVDLNAAKIRAESARFQKELYVEAAHWERVRDQLIAVMRGPGESSIGDAERLAGSATGWRHRLGRKQRISPSG